MAQAQRYKLTLSKLDFISLVDDPAQPNATTLLIKRNGELDGDTKARFVKAADELGLAFFWAFTSTEKSGEPHHDHHGDAVQADDAMVKAAMDFMLNAGGAVDEMHDYEQKSRVVFAMPMTPEIAKAFSIDTKQTGLMIAIKVSDEQLTKLKNGTYTGVSIAGLGVREPVEARKSSKVRKSVSLFTDEVDGHQHQIDIGDDGYTWCSWATSAGADNSHTHAIARDESGAIVILADSGHTHQLAAGQPAVIVVPEGAVVVTEVAARRIPTTKSSGAAVRAGESPRSIAPGKVDDMKLVVLTEAQHAHYQKLAPADAEAFLAKSAADRDGDIEKARQADPVVHKTKSGIEIRKSHGELALMLAKQADENAEQVAKATELATAEKMARETVELTKRADALLSVVKADDNGHVMLLGAVESIKDATQRAAAEKALTALAKNTRLGKAAQGGGGSEIEVAEGTGEQGPAMEALEKGLVAFCEKNKITEKLWTVGLAKFEKTEEGAALKRAVTESAS